MSVGQAILEAVRNLSADNAAGNLEPRHALVLRDGNKDALQEHQGPVVRPRRFTFGQKH